MKTFSICLGLILSLSNSVSWGQNDGTKNQDITQQEANGNIPDPTADQALVTSTQVEFGEVTGTPKYKITCTSGTDIREINVITQADNSVGVVYKKFESLKTMAIAKNDSAYADQVAEKIKSNLETAGFTCTKE